MKHTTTILTEVEYHLKREGTTLLHFADISGVNAGTLSGILSRSRSISIGQLDRITLAMGLQEGSFYEMYVEQFIANESTLHWRRVRAFLLRCAELGKHECIRKVVSLLVEDLKQLQGIFDTAEIILEGGWDAAAVILYECVIESEKFSHSERLAMSYYRLFQIYQKDPHKNLTTAIQFIPYRNRIPEVYALDGLMMLLELYFINKKWDEVESYSDELCQLTKLIYSNRQWADVNFQSRRPLVFYYGKGYLLKSASYEERRMFAESRRWIAEYQDLSWFEGLDEAGLVEVERFSMFARANLLQIDIKDGDQSRIPQYVSFLEEHPSEILEGLITLLESANRHNFFIDDYLDRFADEIEYFSSSDKEGWSKQKSSEIMYKQTLHTFRSSIFFQKYAIYCFRRSNLQAGVQNTLQSFKYSIRINSKDNMVASMTLFEFYRRYTSKNQRYTYNKLCRRAWNYEEELSKSNIPNFID